MIGNQLAALGRYRRKQLLVLGVQHAQLLDIARRVGIIHCRALGIDLLQAVADVFNVDDHIVGIEPHMRIDAFPGVPLIACRGSSTRCRRLARFGVPISFDRRDTLGRDHSCPLAAGVVDQLG